MTHRSGQRRRAGFPTRRHRSGAGWTRRAACLALAVVLGGTAVACTAPGPATDGSSPTAARPSAALPSGTTREVLTVAGRPRTYLLHRPAPSGHGPLPLVIMIHGGGGSARAAEARYGWDTLADRTPFAVAYPDGIDHSWNEGSGCCGRAGQHLTDDVGFLTALVAHVRATTPIDPDRIYATGISEGGIMSYRLACTTTLFAAIGPDSATQLGPCPHPPPISLIHIHGGADTRIRYDGQPGSGINRITGGRSIPDLIGAWRTVDHCPPPTTTTTGPVHTTTAACPDGRDVTLIAIDGAGHQWPGSRPGQPRRPRAIEPDPPSRALDATTTIWDFFRAHPRPPAS